MPVKARRRFNVFAAEKKSFRLARSLAAAAAAAASFLSHFDLLPPPKKNQKPTGHGRHPLPRVRLPDPLQEADQARRAVRGQVERKKKKEKVRSDCKKKKASVFSLVLFTTTTTTVALPLLRLSSLAVEKNGPACLVCVNVLKMIES